MISRSSILSATGSTLAMQQHSLVFRKLNRVSHCVEPGSRGIVIRCFEVLTEIEINSNDHAFASEQSFHQPTTTHCAVVAPGVTKFLHRLRFESSVLPALAQSQKPAKPSHGLSGPGQAISLASSGSGFWLEDFRAKPSQGGHFEAKITCTQPFSNTLLQIFRRTLQNSTTKKVPLTVDKGNVAARASGKSSVSFTNSKVKFSARPWPEPAALAWPWLSLAHGSGFKNFGPEPGKARPKPWLSGQAKPGKHYLRDCRPTQFSDGFNGNDMGRFEWVNLVKTTS
ncbi:hypothetical protein R3P38DRAFT_3377645 [Favolaschia claudopus]|uniref:Uncharacterized protein n=1 Tax=Favolaschia claudopus TaxID=2862362 RepID=A0AAV9ZAU6_9AGAR